MATGDRSEDAGTFASELHNRDGTAVVALIGEIDVAQAPSVREALLTALQGDAEGLEIDLSGVSFLGSSGVAELVMACKLAQNLGREHAVTCGGSTQRRLLELLGLIEYLNVR
jgi:anti-anti-sigma factor